MFSLLSTAVAGARLGFIREKTSGSTITSTKIHSLFLPFSFEVENSQQPAA